MGTVSTFAVRVATAADAGRAGELVAHGFHDDPITEWVVPPPTDRPRVLGPYFAVACEAAIAAGTVYVAGDFDAVAVWFDATTPAPSPPPEPDPAMAELCGPYAAGLHLLDQLMHSAQPREPHHQLAFLVVRDGLRGQGLGSHLLKAHHSVLDETGLGAFLDATNPDSRRLYERHGYRDLVEPIHPPDGPPMWAMWRPAGG